MSARRVRMFLWGLAMGVSLPLRCVHDLSTDLRNVPPSLDYVFNDDDTLTLLYPDSTVCTLSVIDPTDSIVFVDSSTWNGTARLLRPSLSSKKLILYHPGSTLGMLYSGRGLVYDQAGLSAGFSLAVQKVMVQAFEEYPLSELWREFPDTAGIGVIRLSPIEKVQFHFPRSSAVPRAALSLASRFAVRGNFCWTVEYWLKNDMTNGFSLDLFVSDSPEPGLFDGNRAGISLLGKDNQFKFAYFVDKPLSLFEQPALERRADLYYGPLTLARKDSLFFLILTTLEGDADTLTGGFAPVCAIGDTVYFHLRMTVDEFSIERFCDFRYMHISQGEILNP